MQRGNCYKSAQRPAPGGRPAAPEGGGKGIRISHRLDARTVTGDDLAFLRQIGLEWVRLEFGDAELPFDALLAARDRCARYGLRIHSAVHSAYRSKRVQLGLAGRDRDIETYCTFLRNLGKLGIPVASYDFHPATHYTTAMVERRAYTARQFDLETFRTKVEKQASSASTRPPISGPLTSTSCARCCRWRRKPMSRLALHPDDPPLEE